MACDLVKILRAILEQKNVLADFGANSQRGVIEFFYSLIPLEEVLAKAGARLTVICPVNHNPASRESWEMIHDTFGWATIIQAQMREPGAPAMPFPKHDANLCVEVPRANPRFIERYLWENKTVCQIAREDADAVQKFFAEGFVRNLFTQFDRISEHLLP